MSITVVMLAVALLMTPAQAADGSLPAKLLFLGDSNYPPLTYLDQGTPKGLVVDIVEELGHRMGRPIAIQCIDWKQAQDMVTNGQADALGPISVNDARKQLYDFSDPILEQQFSIFTLTDHLGLVDLDDLAGLRVGVTRGGLPRQLVQADQRIRMTLLDDYPQGFAMVKSGTLDAVVADTWVGGYVLAAGGITGIRVSGDPVARLQGAIAVKKGDTALLTTMNAGIKSMQADGSLARIIDAWKPTEVLFQTREQIERKVFTIAISVLALLLVLASIWIFTMRREIARRRRIEDNLRLTRISVDSASDALLWILPDARIVDVNTAACRSLGYTREELLQLSIKDIDINYTKEMWQQHIIDLRREGSLSFESVHRTKGGRIFPVEVATNHVVLGTGEWSCAFVRDISERKRAEEALQQSEERLNFVLQGSNLGYWDWNLETNTVQRNARWAEMLGYALDDIALTVKQWVDFIHPDDQNAAVRSIQDHIAGQSPMHRVEYRMITKEGSYRWILDQAKIVQYDAVGKPIRMSGTHTDITERKAAEEKLKAAQMESEAASRVKTEFLANMSHEIRTPLNGVLGMLQLLVTTNQTDEQQEYTLAAIKSTNRLARLLADILDISKIEAGRMQIIEGEFSICNLRESIMELFSLPAQDKALAFDFLFDAQMPQILIGDETRLRQILSNLVGNAIKFTEKGFIRVQASPLPCSKNAHTRVLFTVEDTGIGITDEQLKDIFEPFVQVEGSYTRRFQGAGLGLSIVRQLVNLMDGEIVIDNTPGKGSTFYLSLLFKLPAGNKDSDTQLMQTDTCNDDPALRILFAEDDETSLISGKKMLEKSGYTVITATDGLQSLRLLAVQDIDLILMDIQMPTMDGVEATKAIRASSTLGSKAHIPIIAMTAYAMNGDKEKFLAAGMNDYISKPVDMDVLREAIKRLTAARKAV